GAALGFASAPLVACAYVAGLAVLLSRRHGWGSVLLRSAGRMSLSIYLAQSVVFTTLSYGYGLGLFGELGPTTGLALAIMVTTALGAFSLVWLRTFRFGPAEWLLRSMSYGRVQPLRTERTT
ncbi:MAG: DUF418 domain-containing protein, partial [Ornithinimicrobium sp.]